MCGIAGHAGAIIDPAVLETMCDAIRHRGPDDAGYFAGRRRRPRHAPTQHHRPGRRPPADRQRGRLDPGRLQRRDLQLPRAARRRWSAADTLPHLDRHGSARPPLRGEGRRAGARAARDVRLRALGRASAAPPAGPRPSRHQAALLLCRGDRRRRFRLGAEVPGARGLHGRQDRPAGARRRILALGYVPDPPASWTACASWSPGTSRPGRLDRGLPCGATGRRPPRWISRSTRGRPSARSGDCWRSRSVTG